MESLNLIEMRGKINELDDNVQSRMRSKNKKISKSKDSKVESADSQNELMTKSQFQ